MTAAVLPTRSSIEKQHKSVTNAVSVMNAKSE